MTEAVTVSNVIAIASLVSEIGLATERQTDRQTDGRTHARTHARAKLAKVAYDFANQNTVIHWAKG